MVIYLIKKQIFSNPKFYKLLLLNFFMGVIRGGLLVIVIISLFLVFLIGNIFLTLYFSLDYVNVKSELVSVVKDAVEEEISLIGGIEEEFGFMELTCQNNSNFVFSDDVSGYVFEIPCEIIFQGYDAVIDYQLNIFVEEVYYEDYDCGFLECIKETERPFFLVSEKAKDYWKNKLYFSLIISIILIVAMFFLIEQKYNLPIVVGSLLAVSALPFMKLNWVLSFLPASSFLQFFTIFFTKAYTVFLISFIFGIIILIVGIILKFFQIGFKINDLFSKFSKKDKKVSSKEVKEIVKKEMSKSNKQTSK